MSKLKVLSLFSGVGGLDRPFHNNPAFEVIAHCEFDKAASDVLRYRFGDIPNLGDITEVDSFPEADIIVGGSSCQSWSIQGNREGIFGDKSSIIFHYFRALDKVKPAYFLFENVEGLLTASKGEDFEFIKSTFEQLGYQIDYKVIDASDFETPQARRRIFVLGTRNDYEQKRIGDLVHVKSRDPFFEDKEIVAWSKSTRKDHTDHRIRVDKKCNTLTTGKGCSGQSTKNFIVNKYGLRDLVPDEAEVLMTWPEQWTMLGERVDGSIYHLSNSKRFKLIGNGVVSTCVEAILASAFGELL